jgi:hypothetical protein
MFKSISGLTAALVIGLTASALCQSGGPQQKHDVTVRMRNGGSQTGKFMRADNRTVEIEITFPSGRVTVISIKTDAVASMNFVSDDAKSQPESKPDYPLRPFSAESAGAAMSAIRALKGLAAAAQIGINREQYGTRLIDVKVAVEESLAHLPETWMRGSDGRVYSINTEIKEALSEYERAAENWDLNIKWQGGFLNSVHSNWESARKHLARAEELLSLLNRK